jgi:hypothetical protein
MQDVQHAQVFNFLLIQDSPETPRVASFKATPETIQALGGELLPATRQAVRVDELDAQGRYRRINTGWGGLS